MKYKIGDVTLWDTGTIIHHYEIVDVNESKYKIRLVYATDELTDYEDWHEFSYVDSGSRLLTPLDKLL